MLWSDVSRRAALRLGAMLVSFMAVPGWVAARDPDGEGG